MASMLKSRTAARTVKSAHEHIIRDVRLVRALQRSLLPQPLPEVPRSRRVGVRRGALAGEAQLVMAWKKSKSHDSVVANATPAQMRRSF
jgi:hypothetical protein